MGLGAWLGCDAGAFNCLRDEQCVNGIEQGVCQPIGYCSFPDDDCASGQRYAELVGESRADRCVGVWEVDDSDDPDRGGDEPADDGVDTGPDAEPQVAEVEPCLVDEFSDDQLDATSWCPVLGPGLSAVEADDVLRIAFEPEQLADDDVTGRVRTCKTRPMVGTVATVLVETMPTASRHTEGFFEMGNGDGRLGMAVLDAKLYAFVEEGPHSHRVAEIPYVPGAQRYWRLRGVSEGYVAEYSSDGKSWTVLYEYDREQTLDATGRVHLGVWIDKIPNNADAIELDRVELCSY